MPIERCIDIADQRLVTRISGRLTLQEISDHINYVITRGLMHYSELIDAREARRPYLHLTELMKVPTLMPPAGLFQFGWRAVVVEDALAFSLAKTAVSLMAGHIAAGVFRDLHEVTAWLARADRPV